MHSIFYVLFKKVLYGAIALMSVIVIPVIFMLRSFISCLVLVPFLSVMCSFAFLMIGLAMLMFFVVMATLVTMSIFCSFGGIDKAGRSENQD